MASTGLNRRATPYSPYDANEENDEEDYKDHPPPAKQMGQGMLLGMVVAAVLFIGFIVWFEERGPNIDHELHAKVLHEHKKRDESHAILSGMVKDVHEKHARGELPHHEPTAEELEDARTHAMLQRIDEEEAMGLHDADAEGMFDALGNQLKDTKIDLEHRLDIFFDMDKNKDAFISVDPDFAHLVRRPANLRDEDFKKLDKNKDGAVGIREWMSGFHDTGHLAEPWYHHKYGFVYGHDIPNHFSKARPGAVKVGTAEHKAAKAGLHPAQTEKKLADAKRDKEHKELNQKAHEAEEREHEQHEKELRKQK